MQYIDIDTVVARALTIVGASGDDEVLKNVAREWVWGALVDLPITDDAIKVTKVYPKNLIIKKPDDFRRGLDIALYDAADCFIPHAFHTGKGRIYPNTEQYAFTHEVDGQEVTHYIPVDLSEDAKCYYLGTNGAGVSYAKIRYYTYPVDAKGWPLIPEEASMTCMYFIRYMASLRRNENQSEIANNERLYKIESDRCRARLKAISGEGVKTIGSIFNRLIPNFNRSRF